jgi:hypothetical protein
MPLVTFTFILLTVRSSDGGGGEDAGCDNDIDVADQ